MPPRITTSNLDLRAHLASGASISMFCASLHLFFPVTANYLPVMAKSSPCCCPVPRAPPIFLKPLLLKLIFLQKPVRRPPILPVSCLLPGSIRENQGAKPLSNPGLILPSSLPSKLGWSPGDLRCVNAAGIEGSRPGRWSNQKGLGRRGRRQAKPDKPEIALRGGTRAGGRS